MQLSSPFALTPASKSATSTSIYRCVCETLPERAAPKPLDRERQTSPFGLRCVSTLKVFDGPPSITTEIAPRACAGYSSFSASPSLVSRSASTCVCFSRTLADTAVVGWNRVAFATHVHTDATLLRASSATRSCRVICFQHSSGSILCRSWYW